jgi:hypothetical protein
MGLFNRIPDGSVILDRGGYRTAVPLYERDGQAHALTKGGFVGLNHPTYTTTVNGIRWLEIVGAKWDVNSLGRVIVK